MSPSVIHDAPDVHGRLAYGLKRAARPAVVVVLCAMSFLAGSLKADVVDVEGQPLAQNARRLTEALRFLGQPLPVDLVTELDQAITARDATAIQELLDPLVLLHVDINPESRVKIRRGRAGATIQQHGYTAELVKVTNAGTVTAPLRIDSPQAGAPWAGASQFSLTRQDQVELKAAERDGNLSERFLHLDVFRDRPMTEQLSGLGVEYVILLIYSSEHGRREATLTADVGQGTEDLGFRAELPVLFTIEPAVEVCLRILDEQEQPSTAKLEITDQRGRVYPPQARRVSPDFFFQRQIYRHDGESLYLPPGEFTVRSSRGPEYVVQTQKLAVPAPEGASQDGASQNGGRITFPIRLQRWVDPAAFGFYSGDHHIHAAGCAHYTAPTEGVGPADMFRQIKGEGLNVGCVLTWGPCFDYQRQFFAAQAHAISEPLTVMKYDLEISGFGSQALGHVCLLNLTDQVYPGSDGTSTEGWPTWTTPVMRWARSQGAVTGYAHSASGLWIDPQSASTRLIKQGDRNQDGRLALDESRQLLLPAPFATMDTSRDGFLEFAEVMNANERAADQLPNLAIPEMNGVGAMEIGVTTALGVCHFISAMDTRRIQEWNTWYHLLNCGFPLKVSGETDFPCMSSTRVGQGRVYVQLGDVKQVDFADWCEGIAEGRSYVSDGFAHALKFEVNGVAPGPEQVELAEAGPISVAATVAFAEELPAEVAHGTAEAPRHLVGDTVTRHGAAKGITSRGGTRLVELVVNGFAVATREVPADSKLHEIRFDNVMIDDSSWVALRHFPQLHTNPVNVLVAGRPIRVAESSARWCQETIRLLWTNRERHIAASERPAARAAFDQALAIYEQIAAEAAARKR